MFQHPLGTAPMDTKHWIRTLPKTFTDIASPKAAPNSESLKLFCKSFSKAVGHPLQACPPSATDNRLRSLGMKKPVGDVFNLERVKQGHWYPASGLEGFRSCHIQYYTLGSQLGLHTLPHNFRCCSFHFLSRRHLKIGPTTSWKIHLS